MSMYSMRGKKLVLSLDRRTKSQMNELPFWTRTGKVEWQLILLSNYYF